MSTARLDSRAYTLRKARRTGACHVEERGIFLFFPAKFATVAPNLWSSAGYDGGLADTCQVPPASCRKFLCLCSSVRAGLEFHDLPLQAGQLAPIARQEIVIGIGSHRSANCVCRVRLLAAWVCVQHAGAA